MEARELRIGNVIGWHLGTGQLIVGQVYAIESDKVAISEQTPDESGEGFNQGFMLTKGIVPIPLTEEWLLRFGFKLHSDGWITGEDQIEVYEHKRGNFSILESEYGCDYTYEGVKIEYVHQLQNLYFALTGEELTVKDFFAQMKENR